jgi:hypothetical protein
MPIDLDREGFGELTIATTQVALSQAPPVEVPIVLTAQDMTSLPAESAPSLTTGPSYQTQAQAQQDAPVQQGAPVGTPNYQPAALVVSSSSNAAPVSPAPLAPPASNPKTSIPWWGWALGGVAALFLVVSVVRRRRRRRA